MKYFAQSRSYISSSLFIKLNINPLFISPACVTSSGMSCISEKAFNITNLSENIPTVLHQNYSSFSLHFFFFILAFLTFHLKDFATDTWIGLNDINHEMRFLWTDGTGVYFTNWAKGFPSGHIDLYAYSSQVNNNHKLFTEI